MNTTSLLRAASIVALLGACGGGGSTDISVDRIEPAQGPINGGQTIVIDGQGFLSGGAAPNLVLFGNHLTSNVTALSDGQIQVVTPAGTDPGEVDVVVFNANGFAESAGGYEYMGPPTVTGVDPPSGDWSGGDEVTITGTGFQDFSAGQAMVAFYGAAAANVRVQSDTELLAIVPEGPAYLEVDVSVSNNHGFGQLDEGYQYTAVAGSGLIAMSGRNSILDPNQGIYFIDRATGEYHLLHAVEGNEYAINGLVTVDGTVYAISTTRNSLYELDVTSGEFQAIGPLVAFGEGGSTLRLHQPTVVDGELRGYDANSSNFGRIDRETGEYQVLSAGMPSCCDGRTVIYDGDNMYFSSNRNLYQVDPDTGNSIDVPIRQLPFERGVGGAFVDGRAYFSTRLLTFGGGGGNTAVIWSVNLDDLSDSMPIATVPSNLHSLAEAP